ncbi:MAG: hypothetical protein Q4G03_02355, partial [Planctomycetia bacterium]|nr:hypothetical protein [Planctomycetia bacterium]
MDVTETLTPEHYPGMHNATVGVSASSQDASQGSYTSWTFNLPVWFAPNVAKNAQTFELTQSFDTQPLNHAEPTPCELADTIEPHAILPDDNPREVAPLPEPETATPRLDVPIDLSHFTDVSDTPIA